MLFLSKSPCSSSISLAPLPTYFITPLSVPLSSLSYTISSGHPPPTNHLKGRGCWALAGIKVIYEWANLPGCWRGKPVAVRLWSSSPLFPPASLQGKFLCLSCLWSFTVPFWYHMLLLSDSQTTQIPTHRRACVQIHTPIPLHICKLLLMVMHVQLDIQINTSAYACTFLHGLCSYASAELCCYY